MFTVRSTIRFSFFTLLLAAVILLGGCAATHKTYRRTARTYSRGDYVSISDFCAREGFTYRYDTLSDLVVLSSGSEEIRLILDSDVAYRNGAIFYLKYPPYYDQGVIMLPKGFKESLAEEEFVLFRPSFDIKTIVIDPGHGGKDPGAISARGLQEKYVNLKVALLLKEELEKRGFRVFLSRSDDTFLTLAQRAEFARAKQADLFVSIHANANHSWKVRGVEVYHMTPVKFNPQSRALGLAKTGDFSAVPYDAKVALWQMLLTRDYDLSIELSHSLYHSFQRRGFVVKTPRKAAFYVLRYAYVPAVLVEMGYLTNPYEEKVLRTKHYQRQIAEAIALGIVELKSKYAKQ